MSIFFVLGSFGVSIRANADDYRKCMNTNVQAFIKVNPCAFDRYVFAQKQAQAKCGPMLLDEVMKGKELTVKNQEDALGVVDIKERAANGDIQELVGKEGNRCGVKAVLAGDQVTVTSGSK